MNFSPLINEDSSIYSRILLDIAGAVFVSGDRLVTTKLAQKYNCSINPIREALKQLQGEGFVTILPNSGARVAEFEYNNLRDVFEVLQLLEPYLIQLFVDEHENQDISNLEDIVKRMELADQKTFRALDTEFHWCTYQHHYNKYALKLWRKNRLILLAMQSNIDISRSRMQQSIMEHKVLIEALKEKDVEQVITVIEQHIGNSGNYLSTYLRRNRQISW